MSDRPEPMERLVFPAKKLMEEHPPVLWNRNKRIVFETACPPGSTMAGELVYTRWAAMTLPGAVDLSEAAERVEARDGAFDYAPEPDLDGAVHWQVNFADARLFVAYRGALFAQDEMQVAEHPALGAVREALLAGGHPALTVENGRPTPVLIRGVERRCRIATDRDPAAGRPRGLYGNAFGQASEDVVRRAIHRIDPPTITNLVAMAAPDGGAGAYTDREIEYVLETAFTAFRATVLESASDRSELPPVVVHSGHWGCGAFGGNRVLMAMLQALAAEMAGLDRLVLHTFDAVGEEAWGEAHRLLGEMAGTGMATVPAVVEKIVAQGFQWGVSNGT